MEESFWKRLWTCRQADSILNNNNYHLIFSYICPLLHVCVQYFLPFWYSVSSYIFPSFSSNFIPIFLLPSPLSPLFSSILFPRFRFYSTLPLIHSFFLLYFPPCHSLYLHQNFISTSYFPRGNLNIFCV